MARYQVGKDWTILAQAEEESWDGTWIGTVIVETAELTDTQDGHVYPNGAHRVRVEGPGTGWPRSKTFKGETAWSRAEDYAGSCLWAIRKMGR